MLTPDDRNHLDLLGIFHYVVAGLAALFSLFPVFHLVMGLMMVSGRMAGGSDDHGAEIVGTLFVVMATVFIVFGLVFALATALAGRAIRQHRSYTFCLVMAGIECLFMPFGTVLGVLTLVKLVQPQVKAAFGRVEAQTPAAPPTAGDA